MAERTVRDFVTQVGMQDFMNKMNIKPGMVRHIARKGVMPAKYYSKARDLADEKGVKAPEERLFDFE